MDKFFEILKKIETAVMALLASVSLLMAVWEMFMRYFFPRHLPDWTSEIVIYLITAAVMVSGGVLVSEGRMVNADLFLRMVPKNSQRFLEIFFCLVGLFVCAIMTDRGMSIVEFAYNLDERGDSSLQFPVFIYYSFVPAAFSLMFLHYLRRLLQYVFAFNAETMTTTEVDLENAD
jgi:TRAP-type C4-dicarboxylate transport system permease small subunit